MTATLPDLTGYTDRQLAELCAGADEDVITAVIAEGERRDREALRKARAEAAARDAKARHDALKREWWAECVEPDYAAAEARCAGNLLSRRGEREGIKDPRRLWLGREDWARARASEELNAHWDEQGGRLSFSEWRRQRAGMARVQRQDIEGEAMDADGDTEAMPAVEDSQPEQRPSDYIKARVAMRQARSSAARAQIATRGTDTIEPSAVQAPARRARPDAPALLRRLLEEIGLYLCEYIQFPSRGAVVATVIWIAHAAARGEDQKLIWGTSPRLLVTSAQNGSGKSTLLDLIGCLLQSRAGRLVKVTAASLAGILGQLNEVALPDDAQLLFGSSGKAAKEVQAVLLGGYTKKGSWATGEKNLTLKPTFGPAAIAGKDQLITLQAAALADLLARSWIIRMERPARYMPQPDEDTEAKGELLGKALTAVMGALAGEFRQAVRDLAADAAGQSITEGDGGRTAQIWRIGEAIARVAGGPWPGAMADAAEELTAGAGDLVAAQDAVASAAESREDGRDFWAQIEEMTK